MNEKELTHIDLFSGIGGFSLAGEWAGFRTIVFCEKEEFCQKILQKRFGAVVADTESMGRRNGVAENKGKKPRKINSFSNEAPLLIPEIRDFDGTKWRGATLLTGGFPCQPFSVAGQRRGKKDDRHLWPEMFRIIKEAKPRWVLAENVTGIVKMALGEVLSDLESIGYDFPRDHEGTPIVPVIPACGLNAPHRRYRVWIIANSGCQYGEGSENEEESGRQIFKKGNASVPERSIENDESGDAQDSIWTRAGNQAKKVKDQEGRRSQDGRASIRQKDRAIGTGRITTTDKDASDSTSPGLSESQKNQIEQSLLYAERGNWQEDWYEVAARFCRVDDGVSDRVHRLKALGNAIVPQIAYEIMKHIAWIENP